MHMFDPERPRIYTNGPPALTDGKLLPGIYLVPSHISHVRVMVMLLRNDTNGGFAWSEVTMAYSELAQFLQNYEDDPEKTLREVFNWQPASRVVVSESLRPISRPARVLTSAYGKPANIVPATHGSDLLDDLA